MAQETLPLQEFKRTIREQFFMLIVDEPQALATLPHLLPADLRSVLKPSR